MLDCDLALGVPLGVEIELYRRSVRPADPHRLVRGSLLDRQFDTRQPPIPLLRIVEGPVQIWKGYRNGLALVRLVATVTALPDVS